ncbi:MAG: DUF4738 domain-containing protein [Prevotella sp.]|nr:DUF4738 domain-containing protein [Prevotella sp.]
MRHTLLSLIVLVAGLTLFGGCKEKKQTDDIIATKYIPKKPLPPIAMKVDKQSQTVNWLGKKYVVDIVRTPVDSLPRVSDDTGQEYIDNSIHLAVKRDDGSVFFEKTFVKGSFHSYVEESFRRNGQLASIRLDEAEGPELHFSVVIGLPDAIDDVFVPLQLTVNNLGGISIRQDDDMGMLDYDDEADGAENEE